MNAISAAHAHHTYYRPTVTQGTLPDQAKGKPSATPAQSARTALVDRPDLASKPFGSLVSLFAQGLPLPPIENAQDAAPSIASDSAQAPNESNTVS